MRTATLLTICLVASALAVPALGEKERSAVGSRVIKTAAGERILVQDVVVRAPVAKAWKAYTTAEGFTAWAAPVAEVDLRVGGTIRTHYGKGAKIGDPATNTLRIINYVPERVLTMRADVSPNWPEILKKDWDKLSNVVLFEELSENETRIVSYGIGYGDAQELDKLLRFFSQSNVKLMKALRRYLEKGERTDWGG